MAAQFVRGNQVIALVDPPACVAQEFYMARDGPSIEQVRGGDKLTVAKRTSNGWLRVKNSRSGRVTSLRAGPWLALAKDVKLAVNCGGQGSVMDLMIRKSQIDELRTANAAQAAELKSWQSDYQELNAAWSRLFKERRDLASVAIATQERRVEELSGYIADLQRDFNDQALALQAAQTRIKELETGCALVQLGQQESP